MSKSRLALLAAIVVAAGCRGTGHAPEAPPPPPPPPPPREAPAHLKDLPPPRGDVGAAMRSIPEIRLYVEMLEEAGLGPILELPGPYTFFTPTDGTLGSIEPRLLPRTEDGMRQMLLHHAAAANLPPETLARMDELDMMEGPDLPVHLDGDTLLVGRARVLRAVRATNGMLYVVDRVLWQPPVPRVAPPPDAVPPPE